MSKHSMWHRENFALGTEEGMNQNLFEVSLVEHLNQYPPQVVWTLLHNYFLQAGDKPLTHVFIELPMT